MRLATYRAGKSCILYDADSLCDAGRAPQTASRLALEGFDPGWWRDAGRVTGEAPGRGASLFLDAGEGVEWVLRPYRRGGLIARASATRYLWTGLERTRAFRELRHNHDHAGYRLARGVLDGGFEWIEAGVVPAAEHAVAPGSRDEPPSP